MNAVHRSRDHSTATQVDIISLDTTNDHQYLAIDCTCTMTIIVLVLMVIDTINFKRRMNVRIPNSIHAICFATISQF